LNGIAAVIPDARAARDPESRNLCRAGFWIPGSRAKPVIGPAQWAGPVGACPGMTRNITA
jgi:hypothetical protein